MVVKRKINTIIIAFTGIEGNVVVHCCRPDILGKIYPEPEKKLVSVGKGHGSAKLFHHLLGRAALHFIPLLHSRTALPQIQIRPVVHGRRNVQLAPVDLQDRYDGQDQQEDGQQLAEAPLLLPRVGHGHVRVAKGLRYENDADNGADADGSHENAAHHLDDLVEALAAAVQVPSRQRKNNNVADYDGPRANVASDGVFGRRLCQGRPRIPDTGDGQRRFDVVADAPQDVCAVDGAENQVHKHEELTQPPEQPVAAKVVDQREQRGVVYCHGEQRKHPDQEEVVRRQPGGQGEADRLQPNALKDLLIRIGREKLAADRVRLAVGIFSSAFDKLLQYQGRRHANG